MSTARTENLPETTDIYMYLLTYLLAAYPTTLDDGEESGGKTDDKLTGRDNIRMMWDDFRQFSHDDNFPQAFVDPIDIIVGRCLQNNALLHSSGDSCVCSCLLTLVRQLCDSVVIKTIVSEITRIGS